FYTVTFDVLDNGVDADSVTIDVTGALDANGNAQADYSPVGEFAIDTLNPTVTSVAVSDLLIDDRDIGTTYLVTVDFTEDMTSDGSADPTIVFTPAVGTTLTFESGSWLNASTYEARYDILDADLVELAVGINVDDAKDAVGNAQVAYDAIDHFDIDTLNPPPGTIIIAPMGVAGSGAFLDRCLDLAEGEEPPMVGLCPLTAIYEVGEFVTGACSISEAAGSAMRGTYIHVYINSVDIEPRPEVVTLLDHWTVHYDPVRSGYSFSWDTTGYEPGYYDVYLAFADGSGHTCRIQLVGAAE
ncbi:hypothetical protein IH601_11110, partial [Candidatus Bipolaricaulota bacterium]|nr:hypothetical protein [Candidatus Bipolaricaulota bacterium]